MTDYIKSIGRAIYRSYCIYTSSELDPAINSNSLLNLTLCLYNIFVITKYASHG